uniref:Protein S100-A9 n=1 Tax=Homo sapiens TaxID=9606 RepID=UPI00336AECD2
MSQLERNIETIINTFHQYSVKLGHPDTLNQGEFKELVRKDLQNFLKKENKNEKVIEHIMEDLDTNADKQLSFEEFIMLMARLTWASNEKMNEGDEGPGH